MKVSKSIGLAILMLGVFTGCGNRGANEIQKNEFGGTGALQYNERVNGRSGLFDEENKYFETFNASDLTFGSNIYLKLDKNNVLSVNCDDASCTHGDEDCQAFSNGAYFVFGEHLFEYYNETGYVDGVVQKKGFIRDCETNKVVFDNPVPEELDTDLKVDDSSEVFYVRVLSDEILKVEGHRHAYLMDKDFNVLYWHDGIGDFPWGAVYENHYYYVNDLNQMVCVDLESKKSTILELEGKVFAGQIAGDTLFYSNQQGELYKYSLEKESTLKIADSVKFFSLYDDKLYCSNADGTANMKKFILDTEGTLVADCTACTDMTFDCLVKMGDKLYCYGETISKMNLDGSGYTEYTIE